MFGVCYRQVSEAVAGKPGDVAVSEQGLSTMRIREGPGSQKILDKKKYRPEAVSMTLAVLYGSRIGGSALLTGTITNLIIVDFIDRLISLCLLQN